MISPTDTGFDYTPIAQLEVNYYLGQKVIDGDTKDLKKEAMVIIFLHLNDLWTKL